MGLKFHAQLDESSIYHVYIALLYIALLFLDTRYLKVFTKTKQHESCRENTRKPQGEVFRS